MSRCCGSGIEVRIRREAARFSKLVQSIRHESIVRLRRLPCAERDCPLVCFTPPPLGLAQQRLAWVTRDPPSDDRGPFDLTGAHIFRICGGKILRDRAMGPHRQALHQERVEVAAFAGIDLGRARGVG